MEKFEEVDTTIPGQVKPTWDEISEFLDKALEPISVNFLGGLTMPLKCPCCKEGAIEIRDKNFFCENYVPDGESEECNFILWRTDLEKFGRGPLTEDEAVKLIKGEQILLKNLKSKAGKKFDCKGELAELDCEDGKKRWKVKFVFEEEKRRVLGED